MARILGQAHDRLGAERHWCVLVLGQPRQYRKPARERALAEASDGLDPDGLLGCLEEPLQASERERGMVGPKHPQAAMEHGGGRLADRSRGRRCSPRRQVLPWARVPCRQAARARPAWPRTGFVSTRSRSVPPAVAGGIPPAFARPPTESPRNGSMGRGRTEKPARARGLPAVANRAGPRAGPAAEQAPGPSNGRSRSAC